MVLNIYSLRKEMLKRGLGELMSDQEQITTGHTPVCLRSLNEKCLAAYSSPVTIHCTGLEIFILKKGVRKKSEMCFMYIGVDLKSTRPDSQHLTKRNQLDSKTLLVERLSGASLLASTWSEKPWF